MIKLLIAGDFCPQNRVTELFDEENYESVLGEVVDYTKKADYSIVNLEAPIVETNVRPIIKCGPNLKCTSKAIKALKFAGFNMVTLANNHFYDYGDDGVCQTLTACKYEGLDVVGGGMNIDEATNILYKDIKGTKFAFINCCEHEFSIATETSAGSNPLNPIQQYYAIQEAKNNADKIIVIIHGGHEHYQLPSPRMQQIYRFFIDIGADVVINHHQHCFSGYEFYNGKPIVYGLGNFCFDWNVRNRLWNEGYMLQLDFHENEILIELIPYIQCRDIAAIKFISNKDKFNQEINILNRIISDEKNLKHEVDKYYSSIHLEIKSIFQLWDGRFFRKLYKIGLLPNTFSLKKILKIRNLTECESHRDKLLHFLKNYKS